MRTLEQIKDEYAVSKGYITIIDIINESIIEHDHERILKLINDISIESQKECLENAWNVFLNNDAGETLEKELIKSESNIIK